MVKIERKGNGYRLSFKPAMNRGGYIAKSVNECRVALTHYFEGGHALHPQPSFCPLCRACK